MKRIKKNLLPVLLLVGLLFAAGCKKFLDAKPDQKLAVPATLDDLQRMLDNYPLFNAQHPSAGEVGADDYYLTGPVWLSLTDYNRNLYTWQADESATADWNPSYQRIYNANVVLATLDDLAPATTGTGRGAHLRGAALFFRAWYHLALAQLYAPPYNEATAKSEKGIPLRTDPDFTKSVVRATVHDTYDQIRKDLLAAVDLLPQEPLVRSRPSKPAAWAALARMALSMRLYNEAFRFADSALQGTGPLLQYQRLSPGAAFPFAQFNSEVLFDAGGLVAAPLTQSRWRVDTALYRSYAANDLRKTLFFRPNADGSFAFKGSYLGSATPFTGIALDELWLIRAEARVRAGHTAEGLNDLNTLLETRWRAGTYVPLTSPDAEQALRLVLGERRKQLLFRTLRWTDLRRLGFDQAQAPAPVRAVNGQTFMLSPGSPRYTLRIPRTVINFSNIEQNP